MARIFISYKRVDKDKVFKIIDQIESALGEECWTDYDGIDYSTQFASVICDAIDHAEVVLFMYSKAHQDIDLENDWTIKELNYAVTTNKKVFFVQLDDTPLYNIFLLYFGTKNNCMISDEKQLQKLIREVRKYIPVEQQLNEEPNTISNIEKTDIIFFDLCSVQPNDCVALISRPKFDRLELNAENKYHVEISLDDNLYVIDITNLVSNKTRKYFICKESQATPEFLAMEKNPTPYGVYKSISSEQNVIFVNWESIYTNPLFKSNDVLSTVISTAMASLTDKN